MARTPERSRQDRREIDLTDREPRREPSTQPDPHPREQTAVERELHIASNGSAIAALVVGMFAATYAFYAVSALAAVVAGIVAVGLGMRGISRANRLGGLHKGLAVSGVVAGSLGLLLGIAIIAGGLTLFQNVEAEDLPAQLRQPVEELRNG
jgi:hypothetical protein